MITANQLRAARALLNIDQRQMAELADLSVPTIQRMEASDGVVRGNVDSLMKLVAALDDAGIELINPGVASTAGGRGVRLREHVAKPKTLPKTKAKPKPSSPRALERVR
jgi:transcriptional regulator with XRE-family HTH domain